MSVSAPHSFLDAITVYRSSVHHLCFKICSVFNCLEGSTSSNARSRCLADSLTFSHSNPFIQQDPSERFGRRNQGPADTEVSPSRQKYWKIWAIQDTEVTPWDRFEGTWQYIRRYLAADSAARRLELNTEAETTQSSVQNGRTLQKDLADKIRAQL